MGREDHLNPYFEAQISPQATFVPEIGRLVPNFNCSVEIHDPLGVARKDFVDYLSRNFKLRIGNQFLTATNLLFYNSENLSTAYMNGVKAICSIMIILNHCMISRFNFPFTSGENLHKFITGAFYQPVLLTNIFLEILFVVGGILTAKSLKKGFEKW